jgi:hypothetical protein
MQKNYYHVYQRGIIALALFCGMALLPWWLCALMAVIAVVSIHHFFELVVVGFFADALYGAPLPYVAGTSSLYTTCALILVFISVRVKSHVRTYSQRLY